MDLKEKVEAVIEKVRPALQGDGGDIELVDVLANDKAVLVRLKGACFGCPMSMFTIKGYVEKTLKELVPEITEVRLVKYIFSGGGGDARREAIPADCSRFVHLPSGRDTGGAADWHRIISQFTESGICYR